MCVDESKLIVSKKRQNLLRDQFFIEQLIFIMQNILSEEEMEEYTYNTP